MMAVMAGRVLLLRPKRKLDRDPSIKIWAIGPPIMMKVTTNLVKSYPVDIIVSLNTIMVDGTGMCGSCRVTVAMKQNLFVLDGPEFDGRLVDWDEFMHQKQPLSKGRKRILAAF